MRGIKAFGGLMLIAGIIPMALLACASARPARSATELPLRLPEPAAWYSTRALPNGVVGGKAAVQYEAMLVEQLSARGDVAEPDGALAAQAIWLIQESSAGRPVDGLTGDRVAQRAGFAGSGHAYHVRPVHFPRPEQALRNLVMTVSRDYRITRYGVGKPPGKPTPRSSRQSDTSARSMGCQTFAPIRCWLPRHMPQ